MSECPTRYFDWYSQYLDEIRTPDDLSGRNRMICRNGINATENGRVKTIKINMFNNCFLERKIIFISQSVQQLVESEDCAAYYIDSESRKLNSFVFPCLHL